MMRPVSRELLRRSGNNVLTVLVGTVLERSADGVHKVWPGNWSGISGEQVRAERCSGDAGIGNERKRL